MNKLCSSNSVLVLVNWCWFLVDVLSPFSSRLHRRPSWVTTKCPNIFVFIFNSISVALQFKTQLTSFCVTSAWKVCLGFLGSLFFHPQMYYFNTPKCPKTKQATIYCFKGGRNFLKVYSPNVFLHRNRLEKFSITSLAHQLQWMGAVRMRVQTADKNITTSV